jgi:regulator of replication initiation timing
MASKRSRIDYYHDSLPYRPSGPQPKNGSPNDPLSFFVNILKKRDGMVARAVKFKMRSQIAPRTNPRPSSDSISRNTCPSSDSTSRNTRPSYGSDSNSRKNPRPSYVSNSTSEIANLYAVIEQLRCSNKQLTDENSLLNIRCSQLESDLKSVDTLVLETSSKCAFALSEHKVLEENALVLKSQIVSLNDENVTLSHKVNTLCLQLSENSVKSVKLSQLKTEIAKLNNVNDVLKKCAKKFEVSLKENINDFDIVVKEKNKLIIQLEESEAYLMNDYNNLSFRFTRLVNCIQSSKDPPEDWLKFAG